MLTDYLFALWQITLDLAPALIAGLLLAGLLHVLLPTGFVHRQLSRAGLGSTVKAVLVGVPLPLCSCGVVPTALALNRDGASRGATTGFLISTPQTGVDSILVSATFLGWPFALFKVLAAAVTGLIGGLIADRVEPTPAQSAPPPSGDASKPSPRTIAAVADFAVHDLLGSIDRWIVFGVLAAALITTLTPDDFFQQLSWAQGLTGMLLMLLIALPLYVCSTASVPIAASFVAAGMPAGTALVFLMAGPATNIATLGAVYRTLGGRILAVYLGTVIVMSIALGLGFDSIIDTDHVLDHGHVHEADWLGIISSLVLIGLWLYLEARRFSLRRQRHLQAETQPVDMKLKVEGMTCPHCVANVKKTLEQMDGVDRAEPDLESGWVAINGDGLDRQAMSAAIKAAGYQVIEP